MRKALSILVFVFVLLTMVVGCGATTPTEPATGVATVPATEVPAATVVNTGEGLTIHIFSKLVEINDQILAACNEFAAARYPDLTCDVETTDIVYADTLKAKFAGGQAPDIFMVQGDAELALWVEHLADMSDQPWIAYMDPNSVQSASFEGKVYGFPTRLEADFYVINKDMFETAGITQMPNTLTELKEVFDKLEAAGFVAADNEYGDTFQGGFFLMNFAIARQADPLAYIQGLNEGTETIVNNPQFLDLANWITLDVSYDRSPLNTDFARQVAKFTNEEAAVMLGGTWTQTAIDQANPDLRAGVMPVPLNNDAETNGKIYAHVAPFMVVTKDTPVTEIATEFLTWLATTPEGNHQIATEFKFIPPFSNIEPDEAAIGPIGLEALEYIRAGKTYGMYMSYWPDGGIDAFGTTVQKYVAGGMTPEELTQELQDDWERLQP